MFKKINSWFENLQSSQKKTCLAMMFISWYAPLMLAEVLIKDYQINNVWTTILQSIGGIGFCITIVTLMIKMAQMKVSKPYQ